MLELGPCQGETAAPGRLVSHRPAKCRSAHIKLPRGRSRTMRLRREVPTACVWAADAGRVATGPDRLRCPRSHLPRTWPGRPRGGQAAADPAAAASTAPASQDTDRPRDARDVEASGCTAFGPRPPRRRGRCALRRKPSYESTRSPRLARCAFRRNADAPTATREGSAIVRTAGVSSMKARGYP